MNQAGQAMLCRSCQHFVPITANQGHPSPCQRNRWEGTKHKSPTLRDDGCSDFVPVPLDAAGEVIAIDAETA